MRHVFVWAAIALTACSTSKGPPPPDTCSGVPAEAREDAWTVNEHFCLYRYATGVGLAYARQIALAPNGDLFVSIPGEVWVIYDADGDGLSAGNERSRFAYAPNANHGLALTGTHVYVSSDTMVYRFPYVLGERTTAAPPETVVQGMPAAGHDARTLLVDAQNRLYVNIGSGSNVDAPAAPEAPPATRAQIRRYDLSAIPAGGHPAMGGELFAAGLRNENGLMIDSRGRMWGVENGRDQLIVGGDDIHFDNPAEEVNLFDTSRPGRNYGYPFCWSEGIWSGAAAKGPGAQHLDPDQPGGFTEAKCQDKNLVVPPAFALPAHLAPLDLVEYRGRGYPSDYAGNVFVTSHGSWNREIGQVGRTILRLRMGANGPTAADTFLGPRAEDGGLAPAGWGVRPVSILVDGAGLLTFSDDATGSIHKIGYRP
jgi:glucose/arabinose dehydrogenase